MIKVYTNRMAKEGAPGRPVYNALKLAARRCPLCGHRDVSTLDHYLPKTAFPLLCVTPSNLVPACSDCNKVKSDALPATAADQTLHPYFDDADQDAWLKAEVVQARRPRWCSLPTRRSTGLRACPTVSGTTSKSSGLPPCTAARPRRN